MTLTVLLPILFGGTSATIATINLVRQLRSTSPANSPRKMLLEPKYLRMKNYGHSYENVLLAALDFSANLIGPLKTKFLTQFMLLCGMIFASTAAIEIDFPGYVHPGLKNIEIWDIVLIVFQAAMAFGSSMPLLLDEDERTFLRTLGHLNTWFYETYVHSAIGEFNRALGDIEQMQQAAVEQSADVRGYFDELGEEFRRRLRQDPRGDT